MTSDINLLGEVSTTGTIFFVTPVNTISKVVSMRFNNPAAYTLTIKKHNVTSGVTITVYSLTLSAGDTITDTFSYTLNSGEYLSATSNVPGTSYLLIGVEYAIA